MPQAKGAAARFTYVDEATRGTTPGSPSMKQLAGAVYGESVSPKIASLMSKAIKATRGRNVPRGGLINVDGTIPFELAPLGLASFLKHALGSKTTTGAGPYTHVLKRGALLPGMTIEKGFTDLAQYFTYKGCLLSKLNMSIKPEGLIEGGFDIVAMNYGTPSGTSLGTPTVPVHSPLAGFEAAITEGGGAVTVLDFSMAYDNDIQVQNAIGSRVPAALNEGEGMLDVKLTLLFDTMSLVNKWLNETVTSIQVAATSGADSYTFLMPKVKYFGDASPKITTPQGIVVQLDGTCYYDTTEATDLKVTVVNTEATI